MDFIEVTINSVSEDIENITAVLIELGITGMQIEDDVEFRNFLSSNSWDYIEEELVKAHGNENNAKVKVYLQDNQYGRETLMSIKSLLPQLRVEASNVNDEEWLNNWKKYYKPFGIGEKIIIKPMWEEYENINNKIVLNINPGHIFGTGQHQTTQMCIEKLEKYVFEDAEVLDLGCGSGILSVASLLLGAKKVFAVDIDPNAIKVVHENASLNGIKEDRCFVTSGDIISQQKVRDSIAEEGYHIAVANIVADVIIQMLPLIPKFLKKDGLFIASGIIEERIEDVYNALRLNGFKPLETANKDGWVCIASKRDLGEENA